MGKNKILSFIWPPLWAHPSLVLSFFLTPHIPPPSTNPLLWWAWLFPWVPGNVVQAWSNLRHTGCPGHPLHIYKEGEHISTWYSRSGTLMNLLSREGWKRESWFPFRGLSCWPLLRSFEIDKPCLFLGHHLVNFNGFNFLYNFTKHLTQMKFQFLF